MQSLFEFAPLVCRRICIMARQQQILQQALGKCMKSDESAPVPVGLSLIQQSFVAHEMPNLDRTALPGAGWYRCFIRP